MPPKRSGVTAATTLPVREHLVVATCDNPRVMATVRNHRDWCCDGSGVLESLGFMRNAMIVWWLQPTEDYGESAMRWPCIAKTSGLLQRTGITVKFAKGKKLGIGDKTLCIAVA